MTWEVAVRVTFVQSGGVVGARRGCELDTSQLPRDEARELESLVTDSQLVASGDHRSPGGRDLRLYEIHVENGAQTVRVTFDDLTLPERARPLVGFLRRKAGPRGAA
ncbi:MAG: protealysin inhibitor emfourin [Gemmatimonadaceae bacterium]